MKKRIIVFGFSTLVIIMILAIINQKKYTFGNDNITYALNVVDTYGNITHPTNFPSKGPYKVTVNCSWGSGKWLYDIWKLQIDSAAKGTACEITFTAMPKTTLANKIISLNGTNLVVNEPSTDYRYEGKNPNNYIWFNNELWRIIGVFGNNTHGQSENLVKIIKANSLGSFVWNNSGKNRWATSSTTPEASLNKLLNNNYYNSTDGTNSGNCYIFKNETGICDFTEKGINDNYRGMIQQVTWKLGSRDHAYDLADVYNSERGNEIPAGASATYKGYIGLMYPSDYGYSVLSNSCPRTTTLINYDTSSCAGQSWLSGQGNEWTLTPSLSSSQTVFHIWGAGEITNSWGAYNSYVARPSLYLKSSVYVVDGDGSINNPYIIMN